jgi:hypothetical protein
MGTGCSRFNTLPAVFHFVSAAARSRRLENELEKTKEEAVNEIKLLLLVILCPPLNRIIIESAA